MEMSNESPCCWVFKIFCEFNELKHLIYIQEIVYICNFFVSKALNIVLGTY